MKHLLFALAMTFVSSIGFSKPLDTPTKAKEVKAQIAPAVMQLVSSIGISGCNPETGEPNISDDFVHCVVIGTKTPETYAVLSQHYPLGTQINGVFVTVTYLGRIVAQPRLSAGF